LANLSRRAIQSAIGATPSSGRNIKHALKERHGLHKQWAIRPASRAPNVVALSGKPMVRTTLKSQSKVKSVDSDPKLATTRLLKISSVSEKSRLRVAEGGRKRPS
jgi:hypothetical protein